MSTRKIKISIAIAFTFLPNEASAATYYVDYVGGNNSNTGTVAAAPWQHAPGDPDATDNARNAVLAPGDIVRFKGGVAYRGYIRARFDGAPGMPITYSGSGFGTENAIFEGADPVTSIAPCTSAAQCGGAAAWLKMSVVTFTPPATSFIKLYDASGLLFEAQSPVPADRFFWDNVESFAVSPLADKDMIESGQLNAPALASLLGGAPSGSVLIWIFGNIVERRPVTAVTGDILHFDPTGITLYPDRPGRYALIGSAAAITAAGQYAEAGPGRAIVYTRPVDGLMVGNGRSGIDISDRSHVTVSDIVFRHYTAAVKASAQGAPIVRNGRTGTGIIIIGNRFEDSSLQDGKGVITLSNVDNVRIISNVIARIERGSGIRAGNKTRMISITGNSIDTVGRTGVAFLNTSDSSISDNIITNLRGIHGNGISLYLNNRRIKVFNNRVLTTDRPMTFHGDSETPTPGDHDFVIERNIFTATSTAQAALTSWGRATRNVTIRNNVAIAPKAGMLMNDTDVGVAITRNFVSNILYNDAKPPAWIVENNVIAASTLGYIANNPVNDALLCSGASIPTGTRLGGIHC
jgi:hypothetical protein